MPPHTLAQASAVRGTGVSRAPINGAVKASEQPTTADRDRRAPVFITVNERLADATSRLSALASDLEQLNRRLFGECCGGPEPGGEDRPPSSQTDEVSQRIQALFYHLSRIEGEFGLLGQRL